MEIARRDTKEKQIYQVNKQLDVYVKNLLDEIQKNIYDKAKQNLEQNIRKTDSYEEFKKILDEQGGFVLAHWDGTPETEEKIKEETKATIRCIPLHNPKEEGQCIYSGKPSIQRVIFAKAY